MGSQLIEQNMYAIDNNHTINYIFESIRLELVKVSTNIEYAINTKDIANLETAKYSSQNMLKLVETYLKYTNSDDTTDSQIIEPVSLSALLSGVVSSMKPYADWQQCDLGLSIEGKYQPVMANREMLQTVMNSLSSLFITAHGEYRHKRRPLILYVVRRTRAGITAGIYSDLEGINSDMLNTARKLYGKASNPLNGLTTNTNAGLYLADLLLHKMSSSLKIGKFNKLHGLVTTFQPSKQLLLV